MPIFPRGTNLPIACVAVGLQILSGSSSITAADGAPVPPAPAFTSPDIKPTLCDWLTASPMALAKKIRITDPLLKPPFTAAPPDSLKGMAAGIRAVQLDVPNRVKAVRYLGTLDCVTYPQAQDMLIATMLEDPSEIVRYEAVMALRNMLTRGCCNINTACECETCSNRKQIVRATERHAKNGEKQLIREAKGPAKKQARKAYRDRESEEQRYDCCRGCANEKVMKALAKVASEKDDECCWIEPSERVREAASEGMCLFKSYSDGYALPPVDPAPVDGTQDENRTKESGEVEPSNENEVTPDKTTSIPRQSPRAAEGQVATSQLIQSSAVAIPLLKATPESVTAPIVPGLRGRCIVALKARQVMPTDPRFSSTFEDRTYYFSSAQAKASFDENPKCYAPAYGGLDPVEWLNGRQMADGQILREHNDQFYLFVTKENWETFQNNPQRFVLRTSETTIKTVSGTR
ncbi:hypothetical protein [Schlesneria paludicola]|uniref:hypothetical protein n=1 Tax=Schlesneria paludicola TaxID=360056 RepID=UPI00029B18AD|nr:hypothetical protein [Schlesneria paludicola]